MSVHRARRSVAGGAAEGPKALGPRLIALPDRILGAPADVPISSERLASDREAVHVAAPGPRDSDHGEVGGTLEVIVASPHPAIASCMDRPVDGPDPGAIVLQAAAVALQTIEPVPEPH